MFLQIHNTTIYTQLTDKLLETSVPPLKDPVKSIIIFLTNKVKFPFYLVRTRGARPEKSLIRPRSTKTTAFVLVKSILI